MSFIFSLSRILAIAVVLALSLAACSEQLSQEELLARAQQSFDEGRLRAAEIDVKTALQEQPTNAEGRRLLGEVRLRQRNLEGAAIEFRKSLDTDKDPAVAALYASAMLGSGEAQELLELYERGFFAFAPEKPELLAALARAQATTGDTFTAEQTLESALALGPDNREVLLAQAVVQALHTGDLETTLAMLKQLTETYPDFEDAWSIYGNNAQASGDLALAERAFGEAATLNRFRLDDRLALVAVLVDQEKYELAAEELSELDKIIPNHPAVNYAQARIAMARGEETPALEDLAAVLNVSPDHLPSLYLAALANFREGNLEIAKSQLDTFLTAQPYNINARQMLATVHLQMGESQQAASIARQLVKESPMNTSSLKILALALSAQGQHAESANVYQDMVNIEPESALVQMELGTERVRASEYDQGVAALEAAKKLDPQSSDTRVRLVLAYAAQGNKAAAEAELEQYRQIADPKDPKPSQVAGYLAMAEGDREQAAEQFAAALKIDPANSKAREGLASVAMLKDDSDTALAVLEEGVTAQPDDVQNLLNLAAVHEKRGETDAMVAALQRAMEVDPRALEPRLMLARYRFKEGKAGETITLLTEVRGQYDSDPRVHQLLVGAFLAVGQPDAAANSARRLVELMPESPVALRLAAQAAMANDDLPGAEKYLYRALESNPDDVPTRKMLVETLLVQNKLEEVSTQLTLLPEGVISEPVLNLARGRLALMSGDPGQAETLLRKAHAENPATGSLIFLSTALLQQGKTEEAVDLLEGWSKAHPDDVVVLNSLGAYFVGAGKDAEAVKTYEKVVSLSPDDALALNNLAWALRKADPGRALGYVDKALLKAPGVAPILDTRATILYEQGNFKEALVVNQQALDAAPGQVQLRFHRAEILAGAGDTEAAIALLQELLANPDFAGKAEAQALLARLQES